MMAWAVGVKNDEGSEFIFGGNRFEKVMISEDDQNFELGNRSLNSESIDDLLSGQFVDAVNEFGRCFYRLRRPIGSMPARSREHWFCNRFKESLELLEPGVHHFAPIDIRMCDGITAWPEQYWFWDCRQCVRAIVPGIGDGDPRRSKDYLWDCENGWLVDKDRRWIPPVARPLATERIVLSSPAIEGLAAFRESGFRIPNFNYRFISDTLRDDLLRKSATIGLELSFVEESELSSDVN